MKVSDMQLKTKSTVEKWSDEPQIRVYHLNKTTPVFQIFKHNFTIFGVQYTKGFRWLTQLFIF